MGDYQVILGAVSVGIGILGYALYFRSIFKGKTKPHPFTWFIFWVIDATVLAAQLLHGGGPGAWALEVSVVMNLFVLYFAITRGEKRIAKVDWACLAFALVGIVLWQTSGDALYAVLCAAGADVLAKIPTIRKSYLRPYEESISVWGLDMGRFALSILALSSLSLTTALFPAEVVLTNGIVVLTVLLRRRQLARISQS